MKTLILISLTGLAVAVPAAQATNELNQTRVQTIVYDSSHRMAAASTQASSADLRALRIRGDALNRNYHLGVYAAKRGK